MKPINLIIKTKTQKYSIIIGSNLISNVNKIIEDNSINFKKCLLIIDTNIPKKLNNLKKKKIFIFIFLKPVR